LALRREPPPRASSDSSSSDDEEEDEGSRWEMSWSRAAATAGRTSWPGGWVEEGAGRWAEETRGWVEEEGGREEEEEEEGGGGPSGGGPGGEGGRWGPRQRAVLLEVVVVVFLSSAAPSGWRDENISYRRNQDPPVKKLITRTLQWQQPFKNGVEKNSYAN